jgi:hypothetical protein
MKFPLVWWCFAADPAQATGYSFRFITGDTMNLLIMYISTANVAADKCSAEKNALAGAGRW